MEAIIISGSHRANSQSYKIAQWTQHNLAEKSHTCDIVSLANNPIPFWDESFWQQGSEIESILQPTITKIARADMLVVITPEWHGMVPAGLKNLFLFLGPQHVAYTPTLIIGVSSGRGGTMPINELRTSSYKNSRIAYLPDHVIVQNVTSVLNDSDITIGSEDDKYIKCRLDATLDLLCEHAQVIRPVKDNLRGFTAKYKNGMS